MAYRDPCLGLSRARNLIRCVQFFVLPTQLIDSETGFGKGFAIPALAGAMQASEIDWQSHQQNGGSGVSTDYKARQKKTGHKGPVSPTGRYHVIARTWKRGSFSGDQSIATRLGY